MTDATTITTLRQQRDDAWAECDRLRDQLAAYERDDHEQARTALEETLAQTAAELREYQRNTIRRDDSVPEWAWWWTKTLDTGPLWCGQDQGHGGLAAPAPDLRPEDAGPITLPIVDVE